MSQGERIKKVFSKAKALEKRYNWVEATDTYAQTLGIVGKKDFLRKGRIQERLGYCFHRAAFQAESQVEFKERMGRAVEAYEKAHGFYEKLVDEQKAARMFRCRAVVKHLRYWLASDPSEKRKLLDECLELEGKALAAFLESGDMLEYGRTYGGFKLVSWRRGSLEWSRQVRERLANRGIEWGEATVAALSKLGKLHEVAKACFTLAVCYCEYGHRETAREQARKYLSRAVDLCEKVGDHHLLGLSHLWFGTATAGEESLKHWKKALECSSQTRDRFLIGKSLDLLAYMTYWKAYATEDPIQRSKLANEAMQLYDKAQHHFSIISYMSHRAGLVGWPVAYADHYFYLARWETDVNRRHMLLEKAEKAGLEALKLAEASGMPSTLCGALMTVGSIFEARARLEHDRAEKKRLLVKAMKYQEKAGEILGQLDPFDHWNLGVTQDVLARIKAELAEIELDLDTKTRLLEEAISSKEKGLKLCNKWIKDSTSNVRFASVYRIQDNYAILLTQIYDLTANPEHLRKAIDLSQKAIESASKLDMVSLMAESHWKIAKVQDILGEHLEAAKNFQHASENFMKAAKKIPQLRNFYQDYASYMQAWKEVEKAKYYHARNQCGQAKEHYGRASNLHKLTKQWNYLSTNYLAWARLEEAEDLSRREQTKEAKDLLQQAAKLFAEARKSIKAKLEKIEARDEKEMASGLVKASHIRREYCLGRIALEEAKLLDRQGDHVTSSKKYGSAAETFQKMAKDESEPRHKELQPIIHLCQAWQMMTRAEAEASPNLYLEASHLFDEVKEHSFDEKAKTLASGYSCFCKALEAGTRFENTRDLKIYSTAKKHMEAAASYYLKAGFKSASEYAKGTLRLFDAYMYMNKAETETEPRKKAKYYQMAEKLLRASAGSYLKAKHSEKSKEVQRLLESVEEEQKLALSLTEVMHPPAITSTTSFSTPTPTHEKAVGLERFEHANIQAHLKAIEELTVGEELDVRLDLVNVAKNFGLLVRVDDLVPPGFKAIVLPSQYGAENGSIDMKGKRLEPFKVESIKLRLQATEAGVINLKPQVIYVDEVGKFRTCKPEPVSITVHPKLTFEFKTQAAQSIFDFLTRAFVQDYMRQRIASEKAGWRTLMETVKHGKVSKSSVYGAERRRGPAISELERRGLVETRVFPGERGRGGRILKMRISYKKETIKRYIDQYVMKNKEK